MSAYIDALPFLPIVGVYVSASPTSPDRRRICLGGTWVDRSSLYAPNGDLLRLRDEERPLERRRRN